MFVVIKFEPRGLKNENNLLSRSGKNFTDQLVADLQFQNTRKIKKHRNRLTHFMSSAVASVFQNTITPVSAIIATQTRQFLQAKMDDMVHSGQYLLQKVS